MMINQRSSKDRLLKDFAMFIDERTRTLQKHLLDVLYEQTNSNGGSVHSEEVTRFRGNPYGAEFSNFFYCRELKLKSWYPHLMQPTREQKFALWQALQLRCGYADVLEPQIWGAATDIYSLVNHLRVSERSSI